MQGSSVHTLCSTGKNNKVRHLKAYSRSFSSKNRDNMLHGTQRYFRKMEISPNFVRQCRKGKLRIPTFVPKLDCGGNYLEVETLEEFLWSHCRSVGL